MAPTYIANFVGLAVILLQIFNIHVAPEALQTTVTTLIVICVPLFTMMRQLFTGRSTLAGTRPK